jgi:NitT/TauT family transport system permease protein
MILATWEAAYRATAFNKDSNPHGWQPWRFPAPSHIVDSLLGMLNINSAFGEPLHSGWPRPLHASDNPNPGIIHSPLVTENIVSAIRLFVGFLISVVFGALFGAAMWRWRALDDFFGPLFLGMQTLPSVCWVPLGIIAFGFTEAAVQFVLVMGSFCAIAISLRDGLRTMPPLYQRAGLMLGATGWRLYRYVLLPASLPALASGLRQGFSFAWRSLMGAEFVLTAVRYQGLGYALDAARNIGGVADVIAIMVVMIVLGMIVDRLAFAKLEQKIYRRFGLVGVK